MARMSKVVLGLLAGVIVLVGFTVAPAVAGPYGVDSGSLYVSNHATPGGTVVVTGSGFAPGTAVDVGLPAGGPPLATATADQQGKIHAEVQIPSDLPSGSHQIVAKGQAAQGGSLTLASPLNVGSGGSSSGGGSSNGLVLALAGVGAAVVVAGAAIGISRRRGAAL